MGIVVCDGLLLNREQLVEYSLITFSLAIYLYLTFT